MNLGQKYKQLFEGKVRSNDRLLLEYVINDELGNKLKRSPALKQLGLDRQACFTI